MAKYIKQEMPDIAGKGEHQVYYRMQTERNIGAAEFVEEVAPRLRSNCASYAKTPHRASARWARGRARCISNDKA